MANSETDKLNRKLLAVAISATKASEIKALLKEGADANCRNKFGMTPLMLSAQYNTNAVVSKALIDGGADVNEREPRFKSTALHLASSNTTNPKIIDVLVSGGADINGQNYLGETPLIMAIRNPEGKIASHLISIGADLNISDYSGKTALFYAEAEKRNYIAKLIKQA